MINFDLDISNPFSTRWDSVFFKNGTLPKHKAWEFNGYKTHSIVNLGLRLTTRGDHAGLRIELGLLGYSLEFSIYDTRHWNYELNTWVRYD